MLIQRLLSTHQLSNVELAQRIGVDKSAVTKWLRGTTPTRSTREKIARAFNLPMNDVLFPEEIKYIEDEEQSPISANVTPTALEQRPFEVTLPFISLTSRSAFCAMLTATPRPSLAHYPTYTISLTQEPGTAYAKSVAFEVLDDSMERTLPNGSIVIADPVAANKWHTVHERIVIICFADHLVVKRIYGNTLSTEDTLMLHPDTRDSSVSPYPVPRHVITAMWLVRSVRYERTFS